ncbi:hypothetical protein KDL01_31040 [Actinospica durhamensis]|uniref:Outer membrane channel protein CpnT-like N-terminal domain-containing protein n=1 Tax=Actinospica durhamensis TaxID=1508375 RepID=A0A941F064_9ACTN|nr:hypothetical protein [Actinospica durhamensis]MBR7837754.1 hypothetical protein [Actinospica durhamensis]
MAIDDLPMPVVTFLNVIGIEWPYLNEDSLHQFAQITREFGQAVEQTHEDATTAVSNIAQAYQGGSTQAMSSGWAHLSATHVKEVTAACSVLADALDAWAVYVVVQKGEALAQIVELAVGYAAAIAAAPETFGASLAALPGLEEIGEALGNSLIQDLQNYVVGKVIEAASKPLVAKVESMLQGLDWSNAPGGVDPLGSGGIQLDTEALEQHVSTLQQHAQTMRSHAATFHSQADAIEF